MQLKINKKIISHRGYVHGPDCNIANEPDHINSLLRLNPELDVEIDLNLISGVLYLGHSGQTFHEIDKEFLIKWRDRLWIHCKDMAALDFIEKGSGFNYFVHDRDDFTLTSRGFRWFNIGKEQRGVKSIMLDFAENIRSLDGVAGICTDYPIKYLNAKYVNQP